MLCMGRSHRFPQKRSLPDKAFSASGDRRGVLCLPYESHLRDKELEDGAIIAQKRGLENNRV